MTEMSSPGKVGIYRYRAVLSSRNILLLIIRTPLLALATAFYSWYIPILIEKTGSAHYVGIAYSLAAALTTPISFISGALADVYGRKKLIVAGTSMISIAITILILPPELSVSVLVASLLLRELASTIVSSAIFAITSESVREELLGTAFSLRTFVLQASSAAASLFLGFLSGNLYLFLTIAVINSWLALLASIFLKETLRTRGNRSVSENLKMIPANLKRLGEMGTVLMCVATITILTALSTGLGVYMPIILKKVLGLEEWQIGILYAVSGPLAFITPLLGHVIDSIGSYRSLIIAFTGAFAALIIFATLPPGSFLIIAIFFLLVGVIEALGGVADQVFIAKVTKAETRGTYQGVMSVLADLALIPAPILGSIIYYIDPRLTLVAMGVLHLACIPPLIIARRAAKVEV